MRNSFAEETGLVHRFGNAMDGFHVYTFSPVYLSFASRSKCLLLYSPVNAVVSGREALSER